MNGIVAYSKPRGKYGRYVFTIVLYFSHLTENEDIYVERPTETTSTTYSCHHCGKWAEATVTVPSSATINPTHRTQEGKLAYYRYDNVEPGDEITITLEDEDLIFYQTTQVFPTMESVDISSECDVYREDLSNQVDAKDIPQQIYDVILIDWDKHVRKSKGRSFRVEEDLISKTMNAEKFEIKELLLEPLTKPPALDSPKQFVEGTLRYAKND